ncbi:hypothetical protein KKA03_04805 [archaeon]|nr:hypothetical protein [archaeon]
MDREKTGTILIIIGVLVWPIGVLILHWKPIPNVLIPHLCFVVPGVYLRGSKLLKRIKDNGLATKVRKK